MIRGDDIRWVARRMARRLGMAGGAGVLLAGFAGVVLVAGVAPLQREVDALRLQLARKPAEAAHALPVPTPEQTLSADLDIFRARFPAVEAISDQLDVLFGMAEKQGLAVDKGQYALVEKAGGALRRFEVTLPVSGSYPQVRALALEILAGLPATALSDIAIEREKVTDGRIRATLRLVLFVRRAP